jgi:hypothetical protein
MRQPYLIVFAIIFSAVLCELAPAQSKSSELDSIERRLITSAERDIPDWSRKATSPIEGSYDVSIQQWQLNAQCITITIVGHSSPQEAKTQLSRFISQMKDVQQVTEDGEDSYRFGDLRSATFRRGRFTINVDISSDSGENKDSLLRLAKRLVAEALKV